MTQPETLAVHAGQQVDPTTHSLAVPIYQTVSYGFDDAEHAADLFALKVSGNIYTRLMNPTSSVLEERITALEGGVGSLATSSGAAAITYSVLNLTHAGDNIIALSTLYGGTYALFANTLRQFGIEARFVDPEQPGELASHVDDRTKLVFCESIGNPALNVVDLDAWSEAAHAAGLPQTGPLNTNTYFIYNFQQNNVLNLNVTGLDAAASYRFDTELGKFTVAASASRKLKFDQFFGANGTVFSVLHTAGFNTTFPSVKAEARLNLGYSRGGFSASMFYNYLSGYKNWGGTVARPVVRTNGVPTSGGDPVKSFGTIDLNLSYRLTEFGSWA